MSLSIVFGADFVPTSVNYDLLANGDADRLIMTLAIYNCSGYLFPGIVKYAKI